MHLLDNNKNAFVNETQLFWKVASELRQAETDKLSDAEVLGLLDELEVMAINTSSPTLAARCRAEIANFGAAIVSADAATA